MRYWRVYWTDADGNTQRSDPLSTWMDAERYRLDIGGDAHLVEYR